MKHPLHPLTVPPHPLSVVKVRELVLSTFRTNLLLSVGVLHQRVTDSEKTVAKRARILGLEMGLETNYETPPLNRTFLIFKHYILEDRIFYTTCKEGFDDDLAEEKTST